MATSFLLMQLLDFLKSLVVPTSNISLAFLKAVMQTFHPLKEGGGGGGGGGTGGGISTYHCVHSAISGPCIMVSPGNSVCTLRLSRAYQDLMDTYCQSRVRSLSGCSSRLPTARSLALKLMNRKKALSPSGDIRSRHTYLR